MKRAVAIGRPPQNSCRYAGYRSGGGPADWMLGCLAATEKELEKAKAATQRKTRRLRGKERIAVAVGKALGHYKMAKHFHYRIRSNGFTYERNQASIEREASLDGIYVIRPTVPTASASSEQAVRHYKELSKVERAFRS